MNVRIAARTATVAAAVVVAALVPTLYPDPLFRNVVIMTALFIMLGQAWNLTAGMGGQVSLGPAAFFGIGQYAAAYLGYAHDLSPWVAGAVGGVLAMLLGLVVGAITFRFKLTGIYFALATLAVAEILRVAVQNVQEFRGPNGFVVPFHGESLWWLSFRDPVNYYYVALGGAVLTSLFALYISRSKVGYVLRAIRDDEAAAEAIGINAFRYKTATFAVSGCLMALAGVIYVQYAGYTDPGQAFGINVTVSIILGPMIGGMGTVLGPIVGATLITAMQYYMNEYLSEVGYSGMHLVFYGVLLVVIVLFLPHGLVSLLDRRLWTRRLATLRALRVSGPGTPADEPKPTEYREEAR